MNAKTAEQSKVVIGNLMQPEHANPAGTVHGGEIMKMMDHAAGIVAQRHARTTVVTARVDSMEFLQPVYIGNLVTCEGRLTFVGKSSMEVAVTVSVEDLSKDVAVKVALTAFFTMVAVNKDGSPAEVPPLALGTDEERAAFADGEKRYFAYKQKRKSSMARDLPDKTALTIEAYNRNADRYAEKFMEYGPYAKHVEKFADLLVAGAEVLDVGCGPGNTARQLYERKQVKITGIDLAPAMVEAARLNVPTGTFYLQDARGANFAQDSFDAVVLSFCIVHLQDAEAKRLIKQAISWLKPGGHLYLSFMEGKPSGLETTSFSSQPVFFNYFPGNEMELLLSRNGLKCVQSVRQEYAEADGSKTIDVFIFAQKLSL